MRTNALLVQKHSGFFEMCDMSERTRAERGWASADI